MEEEEERKEIGKEGRDEVEERRKKEGLLEKVGKIRKKMGKKENRKNKKKKRGGC